MTQLKLLKQTVTKHHPSLRNLSVRQWGSGSLVPTPTSPFDLHNALHSARLFHSTDDSGAAVTDHPFLLPRPVGDFLSRMPAYPGTLLFVTALNLALAEHLTTRMAPLLQDKKLRLQVTDAGLNFDFQWVDGRFAVCHTPATPDLTIRASAHDFVLLARNQAEPDALLFSGRLSMQGDAGLGLLMKKTLESLETPALDLARLAPEKVWKTVKEIFKPH